MLKQNLYIFSDLPEGSETACDLLSLLLQSFDNNSKQDLSSTGSRYAREIKDFSTYIFLLSGPLAYATLKSNLNNCIPSLKSIYGYIHQFVRDQNIVEGVLRGPELVKYLEGNNLPFVVSLSEDQTRITNRVQYDSATNQLVGFVLPYAENGMPKTRTFLARSAKEIETHFLLNSDNVSSFVNVVMAQPLVKGFPAFCLTMFGSNSEYNALDVCRRFIYYKTELEKLGVHVLAICSDSDPKYNSAMKKLSNLGIHNQTLPNSGWFQCSMFEGTAFVQDTEHIGTKLRNIFLKTKDKLNLTIGSFTVSLSHLEWLIANLPKDKHNLTPTTINPLDKQNFDSVRRISDPKVIRLLREKVADSSGTILY